MKNKFQIECPTCDGLGFFNKSYRCCECGGTGVVREEQVCFRRENDDIEEKKKYNVRKKTTLKNQNH